MTNLPEAPLAKEAGIAYMTVAMVTDYDCWKDEHCTVEEIMKVMGENYKKAQSFVTAFIPRVVNESINHTPENKYAIVTNPETFSTKQKEIVNTLINV